MFDWWGQTKFRDWPWLGYGLSVVFLFLVFSLPCLDSITLHGYCSHPEQNAKQEADSRESFLVLCTKTKCTAEKQAAENSAEKPCTVFPCSVWRAVGRYLDLIADDPVALFTALLFVSTALLWWVTQRTLAHAERTTERQLRAYMTLTKAQITNVEIGSKPSVTFVIENTGETPAYHCKMFRRFELRDFNNPDLLTDFDFSKWSTRTIGRNGKIEPTKESPHVLTVADFAALKVGRKALFLWGAVFYDDAFGKPREARFCLYYFGLNGFDPNGAMLAYINGNEDT